MKTTPILYIDTATELCSVGWLEDGVCVALRETHEGMQHAAQLAPMILELSQTVGKGLGELAAIAVGKGPGSYTGLRVGVATAKGLCSSLEIPLIAVNSLEGLASTQLQLARTLPNAWICAMTDARRMEVYTAFFDMNLQMVVPTQAVIIGEKPFEEILEERPVIFVGNGVAKCAGLLGFSQNSHIFTDVISGTASIGARLYEMYKAKQFEDLHEFEPFYLKDFVATQPTKK